MAEADVSKMPNGDQLNGDHSQVKGNKMATAAAAAASGGPESTQCRVCSKRVYEMEKLVADNMVYHKTCFKCCKCTRTLRVGNYASMDAQIFCKPHFIECFKQKGNYEEGFGKERHKNKWLKSEDSSENEADDQAAGPSHSAAEKGRPVAVDEPISISAAAKPCHSAPPAPATTTVSSATAASGADLIDGDSAAGTVADDSAAATVAAAGKSKGEPAAISVSEKKSKFFQAVAESAKPKEHKPEPGKLRSDAWSGSSAAAQPSASTQRLAADGLGLGKSPGIGDKKSLFEAAAASGGGGGAAPATAAAQPPKSGVALRPRHESPGGSSESWRRSASVDDYDGRWSLSSTKASSGGEEATLASGERQSRSTTRAPPPVGRTVPADGAAELSGSVEQKRRAFQLRQNTDSALGAGERHAAAVAPAGGSPLKHKIEEFELHSGKHAEPPPPLAPHYASSESKEPAEEEEEASHVGGDIVVSSSRAAAQLECSPPSADNDPVQQQHHGQPLAAVPEAGEETPAAAAAVGDKSLGRGGSGAGCIAGEQSSLAIDVGEDECFDKLGASAAEPFVREVASIKSKFEAGSEADSKPDSTYRSAAREEIDVIRGASAAGGGGARSRYERALEETSRKQPPKTVGSSVELAPDSEAAAAAAPAADKPVVVEVASLKSRFESSGAEAAPSRDEPPPRLTSTTSGTARQRYQKALEESTAKPVPKTGLTDVPVKVSCSAAASIGADDDDGAASAAAVQAAADEVEKPAAESSKPNDGEFHSVAISSLKSKFEAGGDAAEQSPRATAAAAALDLGESPLQGGSVLARYQRALEESSSKPVAKAEVSPLPTRSLSVRVRPTGSADATDGKVAAAIPTVGAAAGGGVGELAPTTAAAGAVAERLRSPQKTAMSSQHASTAKEAACADLDATASGAAPYEAAPPCKEDACGAKEPSVRVSPGPPEVPQKPSNAKRPVDIQLQVKDDTAAAAVKSPSALSPLSPSAPTGSSQLHRIMNKFQSNADAQPAAAQAHGSRPEPKPLKMPLFEGRRVPADGGDSKDHAASVAPLPFLTKNTKSLKERFEAQEQPQSGGGRGLVVDQKRRSTSGPSSDDGAHSTAHGGGGGAPSVESVAAASSSIHPID